MPSRRSFPLSRPAPPLRFLALVVGGWICLRAAMLIPNWGDAGPAKVAPSTLFSRPAPKPPRPSPVAGAQPATLSVDADRTAHSVTRPNETAIASSVAAVAKAPEAERTPSMLAPLTPAPFFTAPAHPAGDKRPPSRWSVSAWLFARRGDGPALAPSGSLGGSQAGIRLAYRLNDDARRPLASFARAYAPLEDADGAEMAAGIQWRPAAGVPLYLAAERRLAVGSAGRSAFSLMAFGGVSDKSIAGPLRLDAYGQAGLVGLRSRDLFADGSVRLGIPLRPRLKIGAAAWGAAQPGVSRVDIGPQISLRVPVGNAAVTFAADWRFRIAGNASPRSGPAITLSTDF